ncbi:hypothetical protein Q604_UNBC00018G0001, partial [human gut metagenome]
PSIGATPGPQRNRSLLPELTTETDC